MDIKGAISGIQIDRGDFYEKKIRIREKEEKVDKEVGVISSATEDRKNIKKIVNNHSALAKLNVANSRVTLEDANNALANIMKAMKREPGKVSLAHNNVDKESVVKLLE